MTASPNASDSPPGKASPPIVRIAGLSKRYGGGPLVLEDIDLDVPRRDFVSLIGPSGCGKSTVLKLVAGLIPITSGELIVDGMEPEDAREEMAFIFQEATLLPWKTVRANIEMPLRLRGMPKVKRREISHRMLELVNLGSVGDFYPRQLSGGMKMRVSIARALSLSPKILLLDEPFGALDEMTRDHLNEELLDLRDRENWTAFFVTHSVAEAVFLSTRIVVLSANPGKVHRIIDVPFDYPRGQELRESIEYQRMVGEVSHDLRSVER